MARNAIKEMVNIWKIGGLSMELKVQFLTATVSSIASYRSESFTMTKNKKKRIDALEMWCYTRLQGVFFIAKKTNEWVLEKIGSDLMLQNNTESRKLQYLGHICRILGIIENSCTPHTLLTCCSQSKFRILKIRESSARALFLYNCTQNISHSADASVSVA